MHRLLQKLIGYQDVQDIIDEDSQLDALGFVQSVNKLFKLNYKSIGLEDQYHSTIFFCTHSTHIIYFHKYFSISETGTCDKIYNK